MTWFDEATWSWICQSLPIACVDILPVQRDPGGRLIRIGLIRRDSPFGPVWCHLGGAVMRGETLIEAAGRHLSSTVAATWSIESQPFFVNQYFQEPRTGMGHDPRKHAIASCFLADVSDEVEVIEDGEATEFSWFSLMSVPLSLWPGCGLMIGQARMRSEDTNFSQPEVPRD